jgi:hypothetical protein
VVLLNKTRTAARGEREDLAGTSGGAEAATAA